MEIYRRRKVGVFGSVWSKGEEINSICISSQILIPFIVMLLTILHGGIYFAGILRYRIAPSRPLKLDI